MAARKGKGRRKTQRIEVRGAPNGADLCLQCGLCCDGTLFGFIKIETEEREYVESLGLNVAVVDSRDFRGAWQPCPAFVEGCCSLYGVGRPATCGGYRCGVLIGYEEGRVGLDDGMAVIRLVWSLAREIEIEMGLPVGGYNRRVLQDYLNEVRPWENPPEHAGLLTAFYRLRVLGEKYFGYEAKPAEVDAANAGAEVVAEAAASSGTPARSA